MKFGDGDAEDISVTMVSFCVRNFSVQGSGTQKLFTKTCFGFSSNTQLFNCFVEGD